MGRFKVYHPEATNDGMSKTFVSYHFVNEDGSKQGFGNYVGMFHMEVYANRMEKFIVDVEKSIAMVLEIKFKDKFTVKVMYFR